MRRNSIIPSVVTVAVIALASTAIAAPFTLNQSKQQAATEPTNASLKHKAPSPVIQTGFQNQVVLFVSPRKNANVEADGTEAKPFASITATLKTNPPANTIIQLTPGTYNADSGEVFPINLPQGITLRGEPELKGKNILILGGGKFLSPTFAGQNITILAGNDVRIEGLTITNPNTRGTGVWVESSKGVTITNNTFVKNNREGLFLTGTANANAIDNLFSQNGANGLSAVGTSTGDIQFNTFDNNGFGLAIGQRSQVSVLKNRIQNNIDGVVVSHLSTPTFRNNLIANNKRNGIVVLRDRKGQPNPDLGTPQSAGGNTFMNNGEKDINNSTSAVLVAIGNTLTPAKIAGSVAIDPAKIPTPIAATPTTPPPVAISPKPSPVAVNPIPQPVPKPSAIPAATPSAKPIPKPTANPVTPPATKPSTAPVAIAKPPTNVAVSKPVPPQPIITNPTPEIFPKGLPLQVPETQPTLTQPLNDAIYLSSVIITKGIDPAVENLSALMPAQIYPPSIAVIPEVTPQIASISLNATPKPAPTPAQKPFQNPAAKTPVAIAKPTGKPKPQIQPAQPAKNPATNAVLPIAPAQKYVQTILPSSIPIPQTFAFTQPLNVQIAALVPPSSFELGRYIVIIPSTSPAVLGQVRSIVPTAQISPSRLGDYIRVQGYPDRDRAEILNAILRSVGLDSRVTYHSSL